MYHRFRNHRGINVENGEYQDNRMLDEILVFSFVRYMLRKILKGFRKELVPHYFESTFIEYNFFYPFAFTFYFSTC